jgi:hypothetical protein
MALVLWHIMQCHSDCKCSSSYAALKMHTLLLLLACRPWHGIRYKSKLSHGLGGVSG